MEQSTNRILFAILLAILGIGLRLANDGNSILIGSLFFVMAFIVGLLCVLPRSWQGLDAPTKEDGSADEL